MWVVGCNKSLRRNKKIEVMRGNKRRQRWDAYRIKRRVIYGINVRSEKGEFFFFG